jgi:hypothetical protein
LEGRTARNAAPVDPAISTTASHAIFQCALLIWISVGHYSQRSHVPRKKAEYMAAPTTAADVKKTLSNPEP